MNIFIIFYIEIYVLISVINSGKNYINYEKKKKKCIRNSYLFKSLLSWQKRLLSLGAGAVAGPTIVEPMKDPHHRPRGGLLSHCLCWMWLGHLIQICRAKWWIIKLLTDWRVRLICSCTSNHFRHCDLIWNQLSVFYFL